MKTQACIDNYTNGNLTDACEQAKRIGIHNLVDVMVEGGKPRSTAIAIAHYLKHPSQEAFDFACYCEHHDKPSGGEEEPSHDDSVTHGDNCGCKSFDDCPGR